MKSIVALILTVLMLGSSLLPGVGVDQSAKLVDLVRHYHQHCQTDPSLCFLDFMEMHYGANSEHQKHPNHSHHHLPAASQSVPPFTPTSIQFSLVDAPVERMISQLALFQYINLYSFLGSTSLTNPPRC